jgi:hypothetical protein
MGWIREDGGGRREKGVRERREEWDGLGKMEEGGGRKEEEREGRSGMD